MRSIVRCAPALVALFCLPLQAAEPYLEFVDGLRQRRYFDSALTYLEEIESRSNIPDEIRQVIPYERAQTLLQSAQELTNLDEQRKQLDAAQAAFEQFVKSHPNHSLAGRANTARGRIMVEKARVEIWDGDKPSNEGTRQKFKENARTYVKQARQIFEQARDQHKKSMEAFPTFIPEEEKQRRAARDEAEGLYMEAQLDLAQGTYWEAQTYDRGTEQRKKMLTDAAFEFEEIHKQYRSQIGGLYARMWQGKCFEEQDEIGIALGIYDEILSHEGRSGAMRNLKDRALRFRLICLNHEKRKDYELVTIEADEWLKQAGARARTDVGQGIQWELCRAQEALGIDRTRPETQRRNYLNQALNRARGINRFPGELKTPSSAMIQRIMVALDRPAGDPKDFETAYGTAGQLFDEIKGINTEITKAKAAGKTQEAKQHQEALIATAAEMARLYDLALKLARSDTDERMVDITRLRLAYGYLLQQRYLDAAIVANFQMSKFSDAEVGREAGFLAMTAYDYAYSEAPEGNRDFEAQMVIASAGKIAERWPDSDRANDARNAVAKIHFQKGELIDAAEWWLKIPQGTAQYADSRVRAGKSYWRQYVLEAGRPENEREASAEDLNTWKDAAIQHLSAGLSEAEKRIPADTPLPDDLVGAKLTLVSIRNLDGEYQGALDLLTKEPHAVLKEVDVPKGEQRPRDSGKAKSREMASFAYQQLLRSQIGLKNLEDARKARVKLEEVAGSEDAAALTQVFVDFGRELEQELERLKAAGEQDRLREVLAGFEAFLNDLFNRQDGQTFYSLLWIAETYASLAEGSRDDPGKSQEFFNQAAAAYQMILEKAAADSEFTSSPQQITACKLRLVNCLRRRQDFPEAEKVVLELLKGSPNAPDAQFEAARLYQDWGTHGGTDAWQKYEISLYGKKEPVHVWGWAYAARSLGEAAQRQNDPRLDDLHFDARYHLAETERLLGKAHPNLDKGTEHLRRAQAAITGFQRVSKRWPDEEYLRFNSLYKGILGDLGSGVADLPRELADSGGGAVPPPVVDPRTETETAGGRVTPTGENPETAATPKNNALLIILMLALGGGAVAGLYFLSVGQSKKKYAAYAGKTASSLSRQPAEDLKINIPAPAAKKRVAKPAAPSAAGGAAPAGGAQTTASPAVAKKRPAGTPPAGTPQRKPRPKADS